MGLLKAGLGAAGGVMADQWKEFIYCESMPADVLACKGSKRTGGRSSNTRGEDNVISNGSVIAVNDGQGMLVVQNGKIIEVALEPGEFVFDTGSEPSVFSGNLGDSIKETFANIGSRFTFGGDAGKDQRVYFINTKEIIGNKYGTASPVPFRVVDNNIGLDVDISVRCNGEYSYRITNPLLFYTNVCGNVTDSYTRDKIDSQLKSELLTALQPAFAKISEMGIRYSAIPGHTTELARALNEVLSADWRDLRGVEIVAACARKAATASPARASVAVAMHQGGIIGAKSISYITSLFSDSYDNTRRNVPSRRIRVSATNSIWDATISSTDISSALLWSRNRLALEPIE